MVMFGVLTSPSTKATAGNLMPIKFHKSIFIVVTWLFFFLLQCDASSTANEIDPLRPVAATGVAFVALIGCGYLTVVVYMYLKSKQYNRSATSPRERSMSVATIASEFLTDLPVTNEERLTSSSTQLGPRINQYKILDEGTSLDTLEKIDYRQLPVSKIRSLRTAQSSVNNPLHDLSNEITRSSFVSASRKRLEIESFNQVDNVVINPVLNGDDAKSHSKQSIIVSDRLDNYQGMDSFFFFNSANRAKSRHLADIVNTHVTFHESLNRLVSFFDLKDDGIGGWISFSQQNLLEEDHCTQVVDIVNSCARAANAYANVDSPSKPWGMNLNRCSLDSENAFILVSSVILNPFHGLQLTQLDLSCNNLDATFMTLIGNLLRNPLCKLKALSLAYAFITDTAAEMLSAGVSSNQTLERLDLSYCGIERLGCFYIASSLADFPVDPRVTAMLESKTQQIAKANHVAASSTDLSRKLSRDEISSLSTDSSSDKNSNAFTSRKYMNVVNTFNDRRSQVKAVNSTLQRLNLSGNKISWGGACDLAQALLRNSTITYLDLSRQIKGKKIGPDGAREIANALRNNNGIDILDSSARNDSRTVEKTSISTDDNINLGLSRCRLKTLKLARNNIGFEGCRHLASALLTNTCLTELDIGDVNYITIAGAMQLAHAIAVNKRTRLAWLTVGDYRLPVSVLLGDRQIYHQIVRERKLKDKRQRNSRNRRSNTNPFRVGLQAISSVLVNTTNAIINLSDQHENSDYDIESPRKSPRRSHQRYTVPDNFQVPSTIHTHAHDISTMHGENLGQNEPTIHNNDSHTTLHNPMQKISSEAAFSRKPHPISIHPKALTLHRSTNSSNSKAVFASVSEHGMNDELGVVIGTLLENNYNLQYLKLEHSYLPIQKLHGVDPVPSMDLSNKQLTSLDAIIIGILIAKNDRIRKLNLRGNQFADTEGENFIAFALDENRSVSLDLEKWPAEKMFSDGYRTLASRQGLSASGAVIEPQRLEGWFYQSLTVYSAILYYVGFITDVIALNTFVTQPDVYLVSWSVISAILICFATLLYAYTTFRNLLFFNWKEAFLQAGAVIVQLTPMFQAYECVMASMESTAMLDFKYVMGVYKSIPQTFFKTYVIFVVGNARNKYDPSVLTSIGLSIISITVIFIMRYDRKESRRMAMVPVSAQPICAVYMAALLTYFGLGRDTKAVEGFVNFDSYYTAHYVWAYIYQLVTIYSRVVSISWLLSTVPSSYPAMVLFVLLWTRFIILVFMDDAFFRKTFYHNFVKSLSLIISDSAWTKSDLKPEFSRMCIVCLSALTTCEDMIASIYVVFVSPYLQYPVIVIRWYFIPMFVSLILTWIVRWVLVYYWLLRIHFPELYKQTVDV